MTGRPIEAADYHDVATPEDPRLSPDGDRVAFVRRDPIDEERYERTVHVVPTDGGPTRRFTLAEGEDAEPRWSPAGDRLAFTSTRGADDDRQQLWVLPTDGGEARQVTDVVGGVSDIEWRPDGTGIAFVQRVTPEDRDADRDLSVPEEYDPEEPDPRVVDRTVYRAGQQYFDGGRPQVYVVDVADDDEVRRITDCDHDHASPTWGDAETLYVAAQKVGSDPDDDVRYDVVAHDTGTGERTDVHRSSGWAAGLAATPDGRIAHLHTERERSSMQPTELHVYDRAGETLHDVTAPIDRSLALDAAPVWGPDGETLYFATPDEGQTAVWRAPGDASEAPERLHRGGDVDGLDAGRDAVALTRSEADHPGDVFLVGDEEGPRRLTDLNADYLKSVAVADPEPLAVESEQGRVEGWVLTPPSFDPDESYPLVVEVHGGPHAMWTDSGTMWHEFQTLAARGYVVAWCNPRGSTGYGEAFMQAIERDWGAVTLTDVLAVARAVADRPYVDPENVFLTGGSFGGYLTAWAVGHTDYFRAAVSQRGVYDLTGFYGSTDAAYKLVEGDFDTTPWDDPELLWEHSPVAHADAVDTPTLVLHSDDDYRTPANTAELFHRGLRKHGVDTRLVRYPREGHELSRSGEPGHVVDRIERIARWFDGYSTHHDADPALERPGDAGLSTADGDASDE